MSCVSYAVLSGYAREGEDWRQKECVAQTQESMPRGKAAVILEVTQQLLHATVPLTEWRHQGQQCKAVHP